MKTTILTLALALAFSFAAVPADAGLTEGRNAPSRRIYSVVNSVFA